MRINKQQKVICFFFIAFVVFWLILFLFKFKFGFYNDIYSFFCSIVPLTTGILSIKSAFAWKIKTNVGKGVFLIGLGLFFWSIGGIIWAYYNFSQGILAPYPSLADVFYLPSGFLYCLGIVFLSKAAGANFSLHNKYLKTILILILVTLCLFTFYFFYFYLENRAHFQVKSILEKALDILYPLGDILALSFSVVVSGLYFKSLTKTYKISIFAILGGLLVMLVGDLCFPYLVMTGEYYNGGLSDFIFTLGMSCLSFGVLGFYNEDSEGKSENELHVFNFLRY